MASSYTTSFGIEKIGSGEQSGAWGTTTNHNLDILDRIVAYSAVALSGTTHTLTVREASPGSGTENLQDGMYRVIKFTGALGGDNTVTVAPNTTAAYFIIINATTDSGSSGPYSVILTQGSGANITVANGKSAIVYMDGAGSGAAVIDAISNLALATITASGDVTSSGTLNVLGDTAASDKAAVGYTSSEGLILTGQGSTNDVTIKNDADADVITIATGATNVDIVGDVTAGTVNADGDTAASDNAAMGYTSAEGLILTGQGSTNDVTIKNDADADVITIATGGTNVDIVGDVTASTVNADGDTAAADNAAMGYTAAEGLILTGQGSTNDVTIKNDADADVLKIPTGTTNVDIVGIVSGTSFTGSGVGLTAKTTPITTLNVAGGTEVTVATGDSIVFGDVSDSGNTKRDTVQGILDLAGGGGSWVLLSAQTASSSASISFTSVLTDTYDVYCMMFDGVTVATDAVEMRLLFSTDDGSSYRTSAYSYVYKTFNAGASGDGNSESTSAAYLRLADGLDNSSSDPFSGQVLIFSPTNSAVFTNVTNHTGGSENANTMGARVGGGNIQVAEDNDAVQVLASSGNLETGTIRLYGIVNS
jgi:hypothetical protein